MTGGSGDGYSGRGPQGRPRDQEDEESTVVRPATPPTAAPGAYPPPPGAPEQGGWGGPPSPPQAGYGQVPAAPGHPNAAPGYGQAPPPPSYPARGTGYGQQPNPVGQGDISEHLQRAGYGKKQPPAPVYPQPTPAAPGYGQQPPVTPGYGQQAPAPGYGQQPAGLGFTQPTDPGPKRRRKPLILGIAAGVAVLVVIGLVLNFTVFSGGSDSGKGSAGDVVKGYLEALARGDAEAALSYSDDQPGSKDLLSDEILKKQIAEWPITDIRILNDDSSAAAIGMAQVHVTAKFGDKTSDATLQLKKSGDRWRLGVAAIKLSATPGGSSNEAAQTMTIFDTPAGEGTVYVFPGYLEVGSSNKYLDVKMKDPLLLEQLSSYSSPWLQTDITLNKAGNSAIMDELKGDLTACRQSHSADPPAPCPVKLIDSYGTSFVTWGSADTSQIQIQNFNPYQLEAMLYGELTMDVTTDTKVGTISPFLSATADLTKSPPALKYR